MNNLLKSSIKKLILVPQFGYHFPNPVSQTHHKPGLTAKRIINAVSKRLNAYDPDRWNGVPFSFNTHWRDEGGYIDVETSVQVHQALERQFGIDIKDRHVLISDIETAYHIVIQHHDSV